MKYWISQVHRSVQIQLLKCKNTASPFRDSRKPESVIWCNISWDHWSFRSVDNIITSSTATEKHSVNQKELYQCACVKFLFLAILCDEMKLVIISCCCIANSDGSLRKNTLESFWPSWRSSRALGREVIPCWTPLWQTFTCTSGFLR